MYPFSPCLCHNGYHESIFFSLVYFIFLTFVIMMLKLSPFWIYYLHVETKINKTRNKFLISSPWFVGKCTIFPTCCFIFYFFFFYYYQLKIIKMLNYLVFLLSPMLIRWGLWFRVKANISQSTITVLSLINLLL